MNDVLQAVRIYIGDHWEALTAAGTILGIALVSCMPATRPKTVDDWYDYIRHALQTAIPAARAATPSQVHIQTSQTSPGTSRTEDSTYPVVPLSSPADSAQPQK